MGNGIGAVKTGGSTQVSQPPLMQPSKGMAGAAAEQESAKDATLSEDAKASQKSLHHIDGAAKEASLRGSLKRDNPLADPTKDGRQKWVKSMIKDGKLDAAEAQNVVNLAKDDAKLPTGEKDPVKLEPAIINLYVRSGVPVDEARRLAGRTLQISKEGQGSLSVSTNAPKEKMTPEKADKIRTEAEDSVKNNAAAGKQWSVDQIKQDRAGFMRNMVQIDGDKDTKADFKACAPTSLMGGIILSKPEAAQDLAKKLQSEAGTKEFPELQKEPAKSSVSRMASGNFSPKDASVVANALYASTRYTKADGTMSEGVSTSNQMALLGRMQKIGFTPPIMRQDTYGTVDRQGTHVTSFANNTGFDPWPYPGSNGQAALSDGDAAARNQGLAMGPRLGMPGQQRMLLERMQQDGQGGIVLERYAADGQALNPPLKAKYAFNPKENRWERDAGANVPTGQEENLPRYIPLDVGKRRDMKMEKE